jgi:hypothetical protein
MNHTLPSGPAHTLPAAEDETSGYCVKVAAQPQQLGSTNATEIKSENKSVREDFISTSLTNMTTGCR